MSYAKIRSHETGSLRGVNIRRNRDLLPFAASCNRCSVIRYGGKQRRGVLCICRALRMERTEYREGWSYGGLDVILSAAFRGRVEMAVLRPESHNVFRLLFGGPWFAEAVAVVSILKTVHIYDAHSLKILSCRFDDRFNLAGHIIELLTELLGEGWPVGHP